MGKKSEHDLMIEEMVRVNHAGEYSANHIYQSQIKHTEDEELKTLLKDMLLQEANHLSYFENIIKQRHIRPSLFLPIWRLSSEILGKTTAKMGKKYVLLCTEAVEEVIDLHYQSQLDILNDDEKELKEKIHLFREEELEHMEKAENKQVLNRFDSCFKNIIKQGCKIAIKIAKKI